MNSTTTESMFGKTCFILSEEIKVIIKFPTMTSLVVEAIALVFLNIFFVSTVILNAVAVMTIWKSRILKQKTCNFTVLIQSAVDLLNGASLTPLFIAVLAKEISGHPSCILTYIMKKLGALTTLYSLTALSTMNFDRFMAILFPLVHRAKVTKEKLMKYVISVSIVQTTFLSLIFTPYCQISRVIIGTNAVLFVTFTVVVYASICVFTISKKKIDYRAENAAAEERKKGIKFSKELKTAKSCFLVVVCNVICCLPLTIVTSFNTVEFNFNLIFARRCLGVLLVLNSTLNSVIFFWRNKELRDEGKRLIKNMCRPRNVVYPF